MGFVVKILTTIHRPNNLKGCVRYENGKGGGVNQNDKNNAKNSRKTVAIDPSI